MVVSPSAKAESSYKLLVGWERRIHKAFSVTMFDAHFVEYPALPSTRC